MALDHSPESFSPQMNSTSLFLWFQLVTPGVGPALIPRGIMWRKLTKVYKEMLHTENISCISSSFREEEFWSWSSLFLCSNLWPQGWDQFWPQRNHIKKMIKVHKEMLNTKYQRSYPSSFREKNFEVGFLCSYVPTGDPRGEASFDPTSIIWTNLVDVHREMLKTKYQGSIPSSFRGKEFWRWDSSFLCSNLWPPGWGQSWP